MKKLTKLIASTLVVASVLALSPIGASAEWRGGINGLWWYKEGDSWATGWRLIDSKWYYFDSNGYAKHDTRIDGYYLNSNGAWSQNSARTINNKASHDYDEARKKGEKLNYVPSSGDVSYNPNEWTKDLVDLYKLTWYENPTRQVTKGEFMLVQLRTLNASSKRQNKEDFSFTSDKKFNFNDKDILCESAQEEIKFFNSMGLLTADEYGNMNLDNLIKRDEAAKIITQINHWFDWESNAEIGNNVIGFLNNINDTNFNPDSPITLEEILQILDKELGYYGITRSDVAKAMNETFKVTSNLYIPTIEVTDSAKMPSNAEIYPYILSNVDKSVYEKPLKSMFPNQFLNPNELYVYKKGEMSLVKQKIETFYDTIFNIDYTTINAEAFKQKLEPYYCGSSLYEYNSKINIYVGYVKANKIKTTGKIEFQEPILYYDSTLYRARTKVTFTIKESNTKENIFFLDFVDNDNNTYNNNNYCIYADFALSNVLGNPNMYIYLTGLNDSILDKDTSGITTTVGY